ncbi:MAG: hypothetical protein JO061_04135, partial [Acidobacteriaceae bacterium]|nr:hypothetical protein [Acidobacteriaceae bacterium]
NTTCSIPGTVTGSGDIVLNLNHGTQTSQILPFIWTGGVVLGLLLLRQRCSGGTYERIALRPAWLAVSAMLLFTVACGDGGGSSGSGITQQFVPPPITGNVTVTAQSTATTLSPALAHSVTVTVSIPQ